MSTATNCTAWDVGAAQESEANNLALCMSCCITQFCLHGLQQLQVAEALHAQLPDRHTLQTAKQPHRACCCYCYRCRHTVQVPTCVWV